MLGRIAIPFPNGQPGWLFAIGFVIVFALTITIAEALNGGFLVPVAMLLYVVVAGELLAFMWIALLDIGRSRNG